MRDKLYLNLDNIVIWLYAGLFASFYLLKSETINNSMLEASSILFAAAIFVIKIFSNGWKINFNISKFFIGVLLFSLFCYSSSIWALDSFYVFIRSNVIVKTMLCLALVYVYFDKKNSVDHLLRGMMIGGYIVILYAFIYFGPQTIYLMLLSGTDRLTTDYLNPNILGMLASNTVVITLYYVLYQNRYKLVLILLIPAIIVVAASGSRKSILILIGGIFMLYFLHNYDQKQKMKTLLKLVSFLVIFTVLIYFLSTLELFSNVSHRFRGLINYFTGSGSVNSSTRMRANMIKLGWIIFKENPILGIGIDNARILCSQYLAFSAYLHNNYIELLADGGLIGFLFYYSMYIYLMYKMYKFRKNKNMEYDVCLTMMIIHLLMEYAYVSYYAKDTYCYLMLFYLELEKLEKSKTRNQLTYAL